ncbi:MAG: hypothetical protein E6K80_09325 [Candidatus Eisenbacteria bacterium]|uniref:Uncharacterized protein n=1 Tax=Eiseniibacteriota bacterium TaxID=2212470 RepID=A0A538U2S3_UNCEI|nr:MAG: hypothetical protein E6K80_09325 [Candidatus Eisenbacteria bacterium]
MASEPLAPEELALIERLAGRVVELRLEVPAVLTLEMGKPLSLLAGQAMTFFEPLVQTVFSFADYRRVAALVERRDVVETLIQTIERKADEARRARRESKAAPPRRPVA